MMNRRPEEGVRDSTTAAPSSSTLEVQFNRGQQPAEQRSDHGGALHSAMITPFDHEHVRDLVVNISRRFDRRFQQLFKQRHAQSIAIGDIDQALKQCQLNEMHSCEWHVDEIPSTFVEQRLGVAAAATARGFNLLQHAGTSALSVDFCDALPPSWDNILTAHQLLANAIHRKPSATHRPTAFAGVQCWWVQLRPWTAYEKHVLVDQTEISAACLDLVLYFLNVVRPLIGSDTETAMVISNLQSAEEAALWSDVLEHLECAWNFPIGTIKVMLKLDNVPALFSAEGMIHSFKDRIVGVQLDSKRYLASAIKYAGAEGEALAVFGNDELPAELMTLDLLRWLTQLCHLRGVPVHSDVFSSDSVRAGGHSLDDLIGLCDTVWLTRAAIAYLPGGLRNGSSVTAKPDFQTSGWRDQISAMPKVHLPRGELSRQRVRACIQETMDGLAAWLAIANQKSGAMTADTNINFARLELCRAELRQWVQSGYRLTEGGHLDRERFQRWCTGERRLSPRQQSGSVDPDDNNRLSAAALLEKAVMTDDDLSLADLAYGAIN
ncbi:MAG: hypothetical protein HKM24_08100 [Gammaproteobacteria bacterium]|nr:hypothetical protein [Gammaproteobacteria bacterium]